MPATFELDPNVLPHFSENGAMRPPKQALSSVQLDEELLAELGEFTDMLRQSGDTSTDNWIYPTEELLSYLPWLRTWTEQHDEFIGTHGSKFDPPLVVGDQFRVIVFENRSSGNHVDNFWQRPAALSICIAGARQVVGINKPSFDTACDLVEQLSAYRTHLGQLEIIEGQRVQRINQSPGQAITIGNTMSVHAGYPNTPGGDNIALAIARESQPAPGSEDLVQAHFKQYYPADYLPPF